jgi:MoaA/NifB/PqqE/SkfB family radical SAM enzyme
LAGKWDIAAKENRYPGINKWIEVWDKIYEKYGSCHIHFSGGEPFIYPDFFILITHLSKKHTLEFSTNLSFDVGSFIEKMDPTRVRLDASFHPEFIGLEKFLEKLSQLKNSGFSVSVSFVAYPPQLKEMEAIEARCKKSGIKLIVQLFRGEYKGRIYPEGYTESERELITSYGRNFPVNRTQLDYHLNKKQKEERLCYMGKMYGKVYASADVYRCCSTGALKIGNLLDDEAFRLLDEPEPCEVEDCICWRRMVLGEEDKWRTHWV